MSALPMPSVAPTYPRLVSDTPEMEVVHRLIGEAKSMLPQNAETGKDWTDYLELAVNRYIANRSDWNPCVDLAQAVAIVEEIRAIVEKLPTQTRRDEESEKYQQFSTPPHYAYVAAWAANLDASDVLLEPSAGTGSLAVWGFERVKAVWLNELSVRRTAILRRLVKDLGGDTGYVLSENAEQIDNILPENARPSVVLMNPAFSQTAGRMGDKKVLSAGAIQVEAALKCLQPGGRLVAILGRGMAPDKPTFAGWWTRIRKQYTVRANIGIDGREYRKMGTSFDSRLICIDHAGPTLAPILTVDVHTMPQALGILSGVRALRGQTRKVEVGAFGVPDETPVTAVPARNPIDKSRQDKDCENPGHGPRRNKVSRPRRGETAENVVGVAERAAIETALSAIGYTGNILARLVALVMNPCDETWDAANGILINSGEFERDSMWQAVLKVDRTFPAKGPRYGDNDRGEFVRQEKWERIPSKATIRKVLGIPAPSITPSQSVVEPIEIEVIEPEPQSTTELTDAIFEPYKPQRLRIPKSKVHPTPLVQSAAMASVLPPVPTYRPRLPMGLIESGTLSDAQIESVVYAGQAFSEFLDPVDGVSYRRGILIGDHMGLGKGRSGAAIILDSFNNGQKKALWVTKNRKLLRDAIRDWCDIGGQKEDFIDLGKVSPESAVPDRPGILFATYGLLRSGSKSTKGPKFKRLSATDIPAYEDYGMYYGGLLLSLANRPSETSWARAYSVWMPGHNKHLWEVLAELDPSRSQENPRWANDFSEVPGKDIVWRALNVPLPEMPKAKDKGKSRLDQVVEWLGDDSEAVIWFDESHAARNCLDISE